MICFSVNRFIEIWYDSSGFSRYHMFPVMSSAPSGKFSALSLYSFRGLSPEKHFTFTFSLDDLKKQIIYTYFSLTVHRVEGVGLLFGCCLWSTDDLQHWALWLRGLRGQRVVVRIPLLICLGTEREKRKCFLLHFLLYNCQAWMCCWFISLVLIPR